LAGILKEHSLVARFLFWLAVSSFLFGLFVFSRRRFKQVMWVGALSIISSVVLRVFSWQAGDTSQLLDESYFLIGIGVIYGVVWLVARNVEGKRSSKPRQR
jgi:hypothetical protein